MRNYKKMELLNLIGTIFEAHKEIKESIEVQNFEVMVILLTDCQKAAISIGTVIEQSEGEGLNTVHELEKYCENLYHISIKNQEELNSMYEYKLLNMQLLCIENGIKNEIKSKLEVVFLPFKSAMWDSLESVWKAAKEDPICDTYVVPIPYYERDSYGSLGKMYYEGNKYPEYVPITDWKQYNLEERRPDIVFIHNPYDSSNYITSVEPEFYALNIKKYAGMLVYIPYFVAIYDVEEHFCTCPGSIFADRVIVQSELVKKTYVREYEKFVIENNCKGLLGDGKEKFLALGSPKFDKVLSISKENVNIPLNWEKLIKNEDGSKKKVIFYNTTIVTLLAYKEQLINKISSVFETFRGEKNVVLLWRPHPLFESTLAAMRPGLLEEYNELLKHYRESGWGIYDDSSDMYLAIVISDAYYGDWSSVVPLYKATGKPIMIQNVEIKET